MLDPTPPADHGSVELDNKFALGSEAGDQVIMELDLRVPDRRNDLTAIQQALLPLDTAVTLPEPADRYTSNPDVRQQRDLFQAQPRGQRVRTVENRRTVLGTTLSRRDPLHNISPRWQYTVLHRFGRRRRHRAVEERRHERRHGAGP